MRHVDAGLDGSFHGLEMDDSLMRRGAGLFGVWLIEHMDGRIQCLQGEEGTWRWCVCCCPTELHFSYLLFETARAATPAWEGSPDSLVYSKPGTQLIEGTPVDAL